MPTNRSLIANCQRELAQAHSQLTRRHLDLDTSVSHLATWAKLEPQAFVGMCRDVDSSNDALMRTPHGSSKMTLYGFARNVCDLNFPNQSFSSVSSFGDFLTESWSSEERASLALRQVWRVMEPGAIFYGSVADGRTRATATPRQGETGCFGEPDGCRFLVFKSTFAKLAALCGYVDLNLEMIDGADHFWFEMRRPPINYGPSM